MIDVTNLRLNGRRLLVLPLKPADVLASGLVRPETAQREAVTWGVVMARGNGEPFECAPEVTRAVQVPLGVLVAFSRFAGQEAEEMRPYITIHEDDAWFWLEHEPGVRGWIEHDPLEQSHLAGQRCPLCEAPEEREAKEGLGVSGSCRGRDAD